MQYDDDRAAKPLPAIRPQGENRLGKRSKNPMKKTICLFLAVFVLISSASCVELRPEIAGKTDETQSGAAVWTREGYF